MRKNPLQEELIRLLQVGLLQRLHLHVDDSHYRAVWRSGSLENMALGRREALIDEAWPWLGGGELTGRLKLGFMEFGSHL